MCVGVHVRVWDGYTHTMVSKLLNPHMTGVPALILHGKIFICNNRGRKCAGGKDRWAYGT